MARVRGDKPVNGPIFWFLLFATILFMYMVAVAVNTVDDCEDKGFPNKDWQWIPPEWECRP